MGAGASSKGGMSSRPSTGFSVSSKSNFGGSDAKSGSKQIMKKLAEIKDKEKEQQDPSEHPALQDVVNSERLSAKPRAIVVQWLMMGWNGVELRAVFSVMCSDKSKKIGLKEVKHFIDCPHERFGDWTHKEHEELFKYLDRDNDGKISRKDLDKQSVPGAERLSEGPRRAVLRWVMGGWKGSKLCSLFASASSSRIDWAKGMDASGLGKALAKLDEQRGSGGEDGGPGWSEEEYEELFRFLDADGDGAVSLSDFSAATVERLQRAQVQHAVGAEMLGRALAEAMPVGAGWDEAKWEPKAAAGTVEKLTVDELEAIVKKNARKVAELAYKNLKKAKKPRGQAAEGTGKFSCDLGKCAGVEEAASVEDYLGAASADAGEEMRREHCEGAAAGEEFAVPGRGFTTTAKAEFRFVDKKEGGGKFGGEGIGPGLRRRQEASGVWRRLHAKLPVKEALRGFKSSFGADGEALVAGVREVLGRHGGPARTRGEKEGRVEELVELLRSFQGGGRRKTGGVAVEGEGEEKRVRSPRGRRGVGEGVLDIKAQLQRRLQEEAKRLQAALDRWDLSLEEVKALILYTGPMGARYNAVLEARPPACPFRTTLLMLASAIDKLRMRFALRTKGRTVYTRLQGGEVEVSALLSGLMGRGGYAPKGFLGASCRLEEAAESGGEQSPVVLEIATTNMYAGAELGEVSQYGEEREAVLLPGTRVEVVGVPRVEGQGGRAVVVLPARVSYSPRVAGREEEGGGRKAAMLSWGRSAVLEAEAAVAAALREPAAADALERLQTEHSAEHSETDFEKEVKAVVRGQAQGVVQWLQQQGPQWFADEQHYQAAATEIARLARRCVCKAEGAVQWSAAAEGVPGSAGAYAEWLRGTWTPKLLSGVDAEQQRRLAAEAEAGKSGMALLEWQGAVSGRERDGAVDAEGNTALLLAVLGRDTRRLQRLLDAGCAPMRRNKAGDSALHLAAGAGSQEMVEALLERLPAKNDVNARNNEGATPMHAAAEGGNWRAAKALVAAGADVNAKNKALVSGQSVEGSSVLHVAVRAGSGEVAKVLINAGCAIDGSDHRCLTALMLCCCHAREAEMEGTARMLVARSADVNAQDEEGNTALTLACANAQEKTARFLVEKGANIHARNPHFLTPLMLACSRDVEMEATVTMLIGRNANVNAPDEQGKTPLLLACEHGLVKTAKHLIDAGADIKAKTAQRSTALTLACANSMEETAQMLIGMHADVNAQNAKRDTPLMLACKNGLEETARQLIELDVTDLNAKNVDGNTALILACESGMQETAYKLVERNADINVRNLEGKTALAEAEAQDLQDVESILIRRRAIK